MNVIYIGKNFHLNPLCFRIYEDFEADNEIDNPFKRDKTTHNFKQNPGCNGCSIVSELDDVLQSGYYESPLGYDNVN